MGLCSSWYCHSRWMSACSAEAPLLAAAVALLGERGEGEHREQSEGERTAVRSMGTSRAEREGRTVAASAPGAAQDGVRQVAWRTPGACQEEPRLDDLQLLQHGAAVGPVARSTRA